MEFAAYLVTALLSGLIINYLADVLPFTRKLTRPVCRHCSTPFTITDYLILHTCRNCSQPRPLRSVLVIIGSIIVALLIWFSVSQIATRWIGQLLAAYFGLVAVIDIEHRLVLHPVSLAGIPIGFFTGLYLHGLMPTLLGGVGGFLIMLGLYYLGGLFTWWLSRRRGQQIDEVAMGFGDVNLAGICGLLLGWPGIVAGLVLAILLGGMVSLGIIAVQLASKSYKPFTPIPYGPFIVLGAFILLLRAFIQASS